MKIKIYLLAFVLLALSSCIDDKDSALTTSPDFVSSVEGITKDIDGNYDLYLGDMFQLEPKVVLTQGANPADYQYRWVVGKGEVISTSVKLEWDVVLPDTYSLETLVPGSFVVKNTKNGLEYRLPFRFKVKTGYTPTYIAIYETAAGNVEWLSIQGTPSGAAGFTRHFPDMIQRVNGASQGIKGKFIGAMNSTDELAIFTDNAPDYGQCVSMIDAVKGENEFTANLGEIIAPIKGRVYVGGQSSLAFSDVFNGVGGAKYLLLNGNAHAFDGTSKKLPVFSDETFVMSSDVAQVMCSKQFIRIKRLSLIRHKDGTVSSFNAYNEDAVKLTNPDKSLFKVDQLCGMFSEATGQGSNKPYKMHVLAKKGDDYNLYVFNVPYSGTKILPLVLSNTVPVPKAVVESSVAWFGAFAVRYGFYATKNEIYKFDYLNINEFKPEATPYKSYDAKYEILDVFVQVGGTGLADRDDCTVVYLYDKAKAKTTIDIFNTVSGADIKRYDDIIPGKGVDFIKR